MENIDIPVKKFIHSIVPCSIGIDDLNYNNVMAMMDFSKSRVIFVKSDEEFFGIITLGDIRKILTEHGGNISNVKVLVNTSPICVSPEETTSSALHIMRKNDITILPIVERKKILGYITLQDIITLFSPERIYLSDIEESSNINHQKHIYRYKFSSMFVEGGKVLDCACGSGYGSMILSQKSDFVHGIDISEDAIYFSKKNNFSNNIQYNCQSIQSLNFEDGSFQTVVSLETLEHICKEDMVKYLKKAVKWLVPKGCFIGSSPMLRYKEGKPFITNPYHINELPKDELLSTILEIFSEFKIYFFHQTVSSFVPLAEENTGFCIFIARKFG